MLLCTRNEEEVMMDEMTDEADADAEAEGQIPVAED